MQQVRKSVTDISSTNRSRVTNGTRLLVGVDGRSAEARRFRDLVRSYESEFESTTEADRNLIRQAALLALKSEHLQAAVVRGEPVDADTLTKLTGQLRRILADLRRKSEAQAPAPLSIHQHLSRHAEPAHDAEEGED
ncbi:hypothetical protein [Bradyrhizobium sp. SZCCHNR1070]|uniref:hypothetical protein n=1 Tax=Bradyrhizobium sp. SZCCHNR1070 TaxID=3057361 RepID=UPI002915F8EE|nr:hypothetical protein [Bradyrhizobium sp. SZCCHNR1070]